LWEFLTMAHCGYISGATKKLPVDVSEESWKMEDLNILVVDTYV
jgi:hypothetical protein